MPTKRKKDLAAKAQREIAEDASANIAGTMMGAVAGLSGGGPAVAQVAHETVTGAMMETVEEGRKKKP